ncbi:hypothetical protein [Brachyspira hyodysenteriae]|uniref:hypothetical protein n=1 Tax=Brachyspira hyodysenteriae TaxID=159 RepID=UPI00063DBF30|nr:hypothetical protein [Brachyspira hyodysenteriae]KLI59106.1 hypothetical protein SZ44_09600 [Brachyspira hyodysenteriae]
MENNYVEKTAIIVLACWDYESLEIALYMHSRFMSGNYKIFILMNGWESYDCERTLMVAERYERLYPNNFKVIGPYGAQRAYYGIKDLINSKELENYEYVCKMDDDVFPLTKNWLEKLLDCYDDSYNKYKDNLAYVSSLVNNNPFGFKRIIKNMDLEEEYHKLYARNYFAKKYYSDREYNADNLSYDIKNSMETFLVNKKDEIKDTVFASPIEFAYIARWLHMKTTLQYSEYIARCNTNKYYEADNTQQFSINCILFKKNFWNDIEDKSLKDKWKAHDEFYCFDYSRKNNKKIIVSEIPMVHLSFLVQREENRDLFKVIKTYYEKLFPDVFPISTCQDEKYDLENRLRYIERKVSTCDKLLPVIRNAINLILWWIPGRKKRDDIRKKIGIW